MNMKRAQSKQEAQLYDFGPLASILFDRGISSRVHSDISCSSLMSTVRISSVKRKVFGGEWVSWACCPSLPIVKDISLSLTAQSISLLRRGSFLVPVTTSDCLGCTTNRTPSSQQLIIVLTWQKLRSQRMKVWGWMKTKLLPDIWLCWLNSYVSEGWLFFRF